MPCHCRSRFASRCTKSFCYCQTRVQRVDPLKLEHSGWSCNISMLVCHNSSSSQIWKRIMQSADQADVSSQPSLNIHAQVVRRRSCCCIWACTCWRGCQAQCSCTSLLCRGLKRGSECCQHCRQENSLVQGKSPSLNDEELCFESEQETCEDVIMIDQQDCYWRNVVPKWWIFQAWCHA